MKPLALFAALGLTLAGCKTTSSRPTAPPAVSATPPASEAPSDGVWPKSPAEQAASPTQSASPPVATGDAPSKALAWGRELTALFSKGTTAPIWARMTDEMKKGLKSEDTLATLKQQMEAQLGTENKVVDEKVIQSGGYQVYLRTAAFPKSDKPINIISSLDSEGHVAGFFIKPAEAPK